MWGGGLIGTSDTYAAGAAPDPAAPAGGDAGDVGLPTILGGGSSSSFSLDPAALLLALTSQHIASFNAGGGGGGGPLRVSRSASRVAPSSGGISHVSSQSALGSGFGSEHHGFGADLSYEVGGGRNGRQYQHHWPESDLGEGACSTHNGGGVVDDGDGLDALPACGDISATLDMSDDDEQEVHGAGAARSVASLMPTSEASLTAHNPSPLKRADRDDGGGQISEAAGETAAEVVPEGRSSRPMTIPMLSPPHLGTSLGDALVATSFGSYSSGFGSPALGSLHGLHGGGIAAAIASLRLSSSPLMSTPLPGSSWNGSGGTGSTGGNALGMPLGRDSAFHRRSGSGPGADSYSNAGEDSTNSPLGGSFGSGYSAYGGGHLMAMYSTRVASKVGGGGVGGAPHVAAPSIIAAFGGGSASPGVAEGRDKHPLLKRRPAMATLAGVAGPCVVPVPEASQSSAEDLDLPEFL